MDIKARHLGSTCKSERVLPKDKAMNTRYAQKAKRRNSGFRRGKNGQRLKAN